MSKIGNAIKVRLLPVMAQLVRPPVASPEVGPVVVVGAPASPAVVVV